MDKSWRSVSSFGHPWLIETLRSIRGSSAGADLSGILPLIMNPQEALTALIGDAKGAFGADLLSITLYGSGAEGQLRKSSDLNLIFVLARFEREAVRGFTAKLVLTQGTQQVDIMWVLETELDAVVEAFAQKFSDVRRRHVVLYGNDVFSELTPSRAATVFRLRQVLLNAQLRMRNELARNIEQPDKLSRVIAHFARPLRACAATLRELRGEAGVAPKEAFAQFLTSVGVDTAWLPVVSAAREQRPIASNAAIAAVERMIAAAGLLRQETEKL